MELTDNGRLVIERRIAAKDENGVALESVEDVFRRVAKNIAQADVHYGEGDPAERVKRAEEKFFNLLSSLDFLPNSPTLVNAGRELQQLSACFVLPVDDSMEDIFESVKQAALIHKTGGGTGFSFSRLRPSGSTVDATSGIASGPVSFMQVFDKATEVIKQGGTRRGANMGILRVDHPDIMHFINIKNDLTQMTNFNISVAITDAFMEALDHDADYSLKFQGKEVASVRAREVWDTLVHNAWLTGDPGVIFIDRINAGKANPVPVLGPVESTNPCGEQPLYSWDSCNLGSINLANFVKEDRTLDFARLQDVVADCVHFLDNVIDMNKWPNEAIKKVSLGIRRIGLGVMGWADALIMMQIQYDSDEAIELAEKVMHSISAAADSKSLMLGMQRGAFPLVEQSIYKGTTMRNSTRTTIAPTGTISIIAGVSSGIEPLFELYFKRSHYLDEDPNKRHEMYEVNTEFAKHIVATHGEENLMEILRGERRETIPGYFRTANNVGREWHIKMQAAFQKHTDNAVSKTINMAKSATVEDVEKAYIEAWNTGCMGITIYRDGSRENQVLSSVSESEGEDVREDVGVRGEDFELSRMVEGKVNGTFQAIGHKITLGEFEGYVIAGFDEARRARHCFIIGNKVGSATRGYLDTIGILISYALRNGIDIKEITEKLQGIRFEPSGFTGNPDIPVSTSIIDYVARWLNQISNEVSAQQPVNLGPDLKVTNGKVQNGDLCPECGELLYYGEGCLMCIVCGYSKCG